RLNTINCNNEYTTQLILAVFITHDLFRPRRSGYRETFIMGGLDIRFRYEGLGEAIDDR
ncbi:4448_t:CDS:2, partial [Entrophospora sp. SA101]